MAIQFNCSGCGNLFRVGDEMAGRKGKCPKCAVINTIPLADGSMPAAAPAPHQYAAQPAPPPPPAMAAPDYANAEDAVATGGGRRKKRSKLLIPLLASGLVLLLGACGVLGYFSYGWFFGANINSEMKYFPTGTQIVSSMRIDQGLSSDFYKQIKGAAKDKMPWEERPVEKELGIPLADIDRITFAGSVADEQMIVIVHAKKTVKGPDIKGNLAGSFKETKINDLTIYENENEFGQSFCVAESDLVVIGKFKSLKAVIERGKKPELSEAMQTALKKADFSKTQAMAINIKELVAKMTDNKKDPKQVGGIPQQGGGIPLVDFLPALGKNSPTDAQVEKYSKKIESISYSLDSKTDLTLNIQITCKDNVTAEDARKLIDAALVLVKLVGEGVDEFPKEILEDLTTNMKVSSSGSTATATGTVKGAPVVAFIKKMNDKGK